MNDTDRMLWQATTEYLLSRCATEGCEGDATEKLGDTYVCPTCYQAAFQRAYDKEREMGR